MCADTKALWSLCAAILLTAFYDNVGFLKFLNSARVGARLVTKGKHFKVGNWVVVSSSALLIVLLFLSPT